MIKMTLMEIKQAEPTLTKLLSSQLDAKTAYWLGKLSKKLVSELKNIEELRMKLVEKYGTKNDKDVLEVDKEKQKEFYDEFLGALNIEIEFNIDPIAFEKIEKLSFSANEMASLSAIIADPVEPVAPTK